MRDLVEALCSDRCAGRATGTAGGREARRLVVDALRGAGLDPHEQPIAAPGGANVLASVPGEIDRWVLVAAHYDHLGSFGGAVYRGADDNAAAVAILVEVARSLAAARPDGRGVIFAAFDAEEPPHFQSETMGSEHYARYPTVPLDAIDMMVCMDLVGHAIGPEGLPSAVRDSVFALGAERSEGTAEIVRATRSDGVYVRTVDAEVIPPLSDYYAFWTRQRPFLLLTNARSRVYHTPRDVPAALAWDKMSATARWLDALVRANCARDERPVTFVERADDASTIDALAALLPPLAEHRTEAEMALQMLHSLRASLRTDATLPPAARAELAMLVAGIETALA